jgi:hypothetical protein
VLLGLLLGQSVETGMSAGVSVDSSNRYYRDGADRPVFLIGYYDWAAVADGSFIDHPSRYATMIQRGAPYKLNYIRISLGVNRFTSTTMPQSWNNQPTPVPFAYVSGKAQLDAWDTTFWNGLRNQCALAQQNGVIVHVAFFDGVELRGQGGAAYGYNNSFWNPANQTSAFYPAGDYSDTPGGFYRLSDFNSNTNIGRYQRLLIAKAISETATYTNVFYEIGNELIGSDLNWNTAVFNYAKTLTPRPVTQVGGTAFSNGYDDHVGDTAAQVKSYVASFVGHGYPAWIDPDGPGLSDANVSSDELRRAAWYSFVGGAAGWGGFTVDYWSFGHGFNPTTACYYRSLESFIQDSGVQFWNMVPSHNLVSNNGVNSCLARTGEAIVYVLNDAIVNVDLTSISGSIPYRLYDPRLNSWTTPQNVTGGGVRTFAKPAGANDWVIYIGNGNGSFAGGACPQTQDGWGTLGTQQTLGDGITPGVATDLHGNIHVVYMNNGAIYYRKAGPSGSFGAAEQIPVPEGPANYNSPHVVCDTNGDPHVVFERDWYPSTSKCWYNNRKGGNWKTPVLAFNGLLVLYSRLALYGTNAFVTASTGTPEGLLARFSNLSGTPRLDLTNATYLFAPYPVIDSTGKLFVIGRNSASGHYLQRYDLNLNPVGAGVKLSTGTPNKTGEPTAAVIDRANLIHAIGNCGGTGIDPESSSDIWYNKSSDGSAPAQGSILGLSGPGWMGHVVYPHSALDANGRIYLAYRNEATGEGNITIVTNGQFADPVRFTTAITDPNTSEQRRWNCQIAPALGGGVYVTWDYNGKCYIRPVGAPVVNDPATLIPAAAPWRYWDSTNPVPANWAATNFNDSAWPSGPAQLGFGDGDEATIINNNPLRITTYFRHGFTVADPLLWAGYQFDLLRDDGAVVYLNGAEVYRSNMPQGPISPGTFAASLALPADETTTFYSAGIEAALLRPGTNVVAVEVHQNNTNSSDLSFVLRLTGTNPTPAALIPAGAVWRYRDTGVAPAANWTSIAYNDSVWTNGPAQLGYGDGDETTTVGYGPDANNKYITTWFRRAFSIADPTGLRYMTLRVLRDDGVVVYLNGTEIFRNNMPAGAITAATLALTTIGGADESAWLTAAINPTLAVAGTNVVGVEMHQSGTNSTDISFDLELLGYPVTSLPQLGATVQPGALAVNWPAWGESYKLLCATNLKPPIVWSAVTNEPVLSSNQWRVALSALTNGSRFYRLQAP